MRSVRRITSAAVVAAVAVAGVAWACVPQPLVVITPQASGVVGSQTTVEALAVSGPAEIRWNSAQGPLLGSGAGPSFSVPVKIPDAGPGLYSILVLERRPDGSVGSSGRAAFEVTGSSGAANAADTTDATVGTTTVPESTSSSLSPAALVLAALVGLVAGGLGGALVSRRLRAAGR